MIDRRIDHTTRKRVSQMSAEEMRRILLISENTGLPNRRAFDEAGQSTFVAMADVNGLKALKLIVTDTRPATRSSANLPKSLLKSAWIATTRRATSFSAAANR